MWPHHIGVIYITFPSFWFKGESINSSFLEHLHVKISNYWGQRRTHRHTLYLFIKHLLECEESRFQAHLHKCGYVSIGQGSYGINCFIDGDFCVKGDNIKAN